MGRKRDQRNILIGVLLIAIVVMSVGYAAFATTFTIGGTATIPNSWDVAITNISVTNTTGNATSTTSTYTATTATFAANLTAPGDSIEYTITVANAGTTDAKLQQLVPVITGDAPAINFSFVNPPQANSILKSGEVLTLKVVATFNSKFEGIVSPDANSKAITITLDYVQSN